MKTKLKLLKLKTTIISHIYERSSVQGKHIAHNNKEFSKKINMWITIWKKLNVLQNEKGAPKMH